MVSKTSKDTTAELEYLARALKAPTLRESAARLAERAREESWTHEEYLTACLQREVTAREAHGGEGRIRAARFPARKSLEDFDYDHARGLKRETVAHLGTLDFVAGKENVILLGPPGTGKTHLGTGLAIRACQAECASLKWPHLGFSAGLKWPHPRPIAPRTFVHVCQGEHEMSGVKVRSRVEQFERIRRDARDQELSIRALADKHQVHRRTVRAALVDAVPPTRKPPARIAPVLGPYEATIRGWLISDLTAPRKQRHTARRVWQRLLEEEGAVVAESSVRNLVAVLKLEINGTAGQVMVPQTHPAAEEAEVDFGEFQAVIAGVVMKLFMFCLRLSHSGKAVHVAYANQSQESFLDGHVRAFEVLGGVPVGMIRYDNLTPAVVRVALGRERLENPRFVALRSHYGYDSFFCVPGIEGAHEKGGVEGEIGRFRRRHLTPVPHVGSLAALNAAMAAGDARDDTRRIGARAETVGAAAARELPLLRPLPDTAFEVAARLSCRVDAKARVCVRQSYYSVPARYAGRRLEVRLGATTVVAYDAGKAVAAHTRSLHKGSEDLVLDHYLEVLGRKPGALSGATALVAARADGGFTTTHQRFWNAARRGLGDGPGTRALVGVLLLHRTMPAAAVAAGMDAALAATTFDADLVAVEARRSMHAPTTVMVPLPPTAGPAAAIARPTPSLADYDQLLNHVPKQATA